MNALKLVKNQSPLVVCRSKDGSSNVVLLFFQLLLQLLLLLQHLSARQASK